MNSKVKKIGRIALILAISLPLIAAASAAVLWFVPDAPYSGIGEGRIEFVVEPAPRSNIDAVVQDLYEAGLISNTWYLSIRYKIMSRLNLQDQLKAGRFELEYGLRPSELIAALTSPTNDNRVFEALLVPPGLTASEVAEVVEAAGFAYAGDVRKAILEVAPDYPVLDNAFGLQGYLFPDTYHIESPLELTAESSRLQAEMIVRTMADSFFRVLDDIDPGWKGLTEAQLHEKITLASIVEREYRVAEEAPSIAAVFNNRLNVGMPLQSCATLDYALLETDEGRPFRNEYLGSNRRILIRYTTDVHSGFNTYWEQGLPPGPISIPGRTALDAAFFPSDIDALFFVVKDVSAGTHTFTRDYADHLEARESYLNQYVVKD